MKIQFLKNTMEKGKKVPTIFRANEVREFENDVAKQYIDEGRAVEFKAEKPAKETKPKAEKPAKDAA